MAIDFEIYHDFFIDSVVCQLKYVSMVDSAICFGCLRRVLDLSKRRQSAHSIQFLCQRGLSLLLHQLHFEYGFL